MSAVDVGADAVCPAQAHDDSLVGLRLSQQPDLHKPVPGLEVRFAPVPDRTPASRR